MKIRKTLAERFASKVNTNGPIPAHAPELGPCHLWTGGRSQNGRGYGVIMLGGEFGRKLAAAHRVAWFLAYGRWPEPCGLHRCDNVQCVRLDHLFEGSMKENVDDMIAKGRYAGGGPKGERHGNARFTERDVRRMRSLRLKGHTLQRIANRFATTMTTVSDIVRRKAWAHVA